MALLVSCDRSPDYLTKEFSATVAENSGIVAKSIRTLLRTLSLLKLGTFYLQPVAATLVTHEVPEKMVTAYQTMHKVERAPTVVSTISREAHPPLRDYLNHPELDAILDQCRVQKPCARTASQSHPQGD